jgi:hypothetical protein
VGRYFLYVGCALVALLFIVDWISPGSAPTPVQQASTQTPTSDTILRIRSEQKWPEKVVLDTSKPTIVPPPPPVAIATTAPAAVASAAVASPLEARAEVKPAAQPVAPPKRQARVHHRSPRPADPSPGYSGWGNSGWGNSTWAAAGPPQRPWSWNW